MLFYKKFYWYQVCLGTIFSMANASTTTLNLALVNQHVKQASGYKFGSPHSQY